MGGLKAYQGYNILQYVRSPGLARRAEDKFTRLRHRYHGIKGGAPDLSNPREYRRYLRAERKMLAAFRSADPADVKAAQRHFRWLCGLQGDSGALRSLQARYPALAPHQTRGPAGRLSRVTAPWRASGVSRPGSWPWAS